VKSVVKNWFQNLPEDYTEAKFWGLSRDAGRWKVRRKIMGQSFSRRQVCKLFRDAALAGAALIGGGRALAAGGASDAAGASATASQPASANQPEPARPVVTGPVRVRFLGTGAADHQWKRIGEPGVRGSCSTLVDGHVLIDCGATGMSNLARAGVAPGALTDLVLTHSHGDHFSIPEIRKVLDARGADLPPLGVWAAPQLIAALERRLAGRFNGHALAAGTAFAIGRLRLTALPANHMIEADPTEQPLHYLVSTPRGNLLYALDGAWMLKPERLLIGKTRLDMIVWDATIGGKPGDRRIFEHNDLAMIAHMERTLKAAGCIDGQTVRVLDHTARTLWPGDPGEARRLASEGGWVLADDGLELELGAGA
jgi:L-ascorbate metabolism protein UlaG (beta-lactamase superfamily)